MKTCTICKKLKSLNAFYGNKLTKDRRGSQCKKCDTTERRYRRIEKKEKVVALLGGKCQKCGYNKCLAALDFHHTDSNKEKDMNKILNRGMKRILIEAKKCTLLCANCHREIHVELRELASGDANSL